MIEQQNGEGMYRYSKKEFNDSLCKMGRIRIGTLHDFRKTEHKSGIADPSEGKKTVIHPINYLHIKDPSRKEIGNQRDLNALKAFDIINVVGKNVTLSNFSLFKDFEQPDVFILCTSKFASIETMSQFEGANSCVKIDNIDLFYKLITEILNSITPVSFDGVFEVTYKDRLELWNGETWGSNPALIKGREFSLQGELRAIWTPKETTEIKPLIISDYRIGSCVSHLAVLQTKI